jgi:SAM-dependent methyltransferase
VVDRDGGASRLVDPAGAWDAPANADTYERGRPSYPPRAIDHLQRVLDLRPGRSVLDLGAGTGKFTRLLIPTGATPVVAVEPLTAMREALLQATAGADRDAGADVSVSIVAAVAEALPFAASSFDAITCATAFHWFDASRAVPEMARVLRPGGHVALVWNERDEGVPWVAEMTRVIRWEGYRPYGVAFDWRPVLEHGGQFVLEGRAQFPFTQTLDRAGYADRVRSISYISTLPHDEQQRTVDAALGVVQDFGDEIEMPYLTDVVWCRRR